MGNIRFHIDKAERNERFFQSNNLRASQFNEWGVVVLFYSAMHYADAILAKEFSQRSLYRHPGRHSRRNKGVALSSTLRAIHNDYRVLYDRSRDARYTHISFPAGFLNSLETTRFEPIKRCVRTALNLP